jgi:peroxiredoxin
MSNTATRRRTPLEPGTPAPDFRLPTTPEQKVSPSDFAGQPVILAFYPADWSPVCSDQMALYQEVMPDGSARNSPSMSTPQRCARTS